MKKMIVLLMAVLLCMSMVLPVCAAGQEFVPSITYKDGLTDVKATVDGEDVGGCVIITSIKEAKEKTTDISQESRDELLEVYEKLSDGSMKLPLEGDYVVVELVDISFAESACVNNTEHQHVEWLAEPENVITIDVGYMDKTKDVVVLYYHDGEWKTAESVVNNGDGTFTCVFEDICPVAFCVEASKMEESPKTGDTSDVLLWVAVMAIAAVALVAVLVLYRRRDVK